MYTLQTPQDRSSQGACWRSDLASEPNTSSAEDRSTRSHETDGQFSHRTMSEKKMFWCLTRESESSNPARYVDPPIPGKMPGAAAAPAPQDGGQLE